MNKYWVSLLYLLYVLYNLTLLGPPCLFFLKLIAYCFSRMFLILHYPTRLLHILCILFLLFCYGFLSLFFFFTKNHRFLNAMYLIYQLVFLFFLIFYVKHFFLYLHQNKAYVMVADQCPVHIHLFSIYIHVV